MHPLIRWNLAHPYLCLGLLLFITAGFGLQVLDLQINTSAEAMFSQDDPDRLFYDEFVAKFGTDKSFSVFFEPEDPFRVDILRHIERMTESFEAIESVEEVLSLTNLTLLREDEGFVSVTTLAEELSLLEGEDTTEIQAWIDTDPLPRKLAILSDHGRGVALHIFVPQDLPTDSLVRVVDSIRAVLKEDGLADIRYYVGGMPIGDVEHYKAFMSDLLTVNPLMIGLVMLILLAQFRHPLVAWTPLLIVWLTSVWTLGLISIVGWPLTPLTQIALPIILVYGVLGCTHFMTDFQRRLASGKPVREAIDETTRHVLRPCGYASLTTGLGFLSLAMSPVPVVTQVGIYSAFGILVCFSITFLVLPIAIDRWLGTKFRTSRAKSSPMDGFLEGLGRLTLQRKRWLAVIGLLSFAAPVYWVFQVTVDVDMIKLFDPEAEIPQTEAAGLRIFGPWAPLEISLAARDGQPLDRPESLRAMRDIQRFLEEYDHVGHTLSPADFVAYGLGRGPDEIPDQPFQIKRILAEASQLGGKNGLAAYLRPNEPLEARLVARSILLPAREHAAFFAEVTAYAEERLGPQVDVRLTGYTVLTQNLLNEVLLTEIQSFTVAFLLIFACITILFRSLRLGLISIPANLFPVLVVLGLMGLLEINLDVGTCTVASIALAIAVDDSIHLVYRYRLERKKRRDPEQALLTSIRAVGRPILLTSLTLTVGFWVLLLSSYVPVSKFGFLTGAAVVAALISDLVFLPALLHRFAFHPK